MLSVHLPTRTIRYTSREVPTLDLRRIGKKSPLLPSHPFTPSSTISPAKSSTRARSGLSILTSTTTAINGSYSLTPVKRAGRYDSQQPAVQPRSSSKKLAGASTSSPMVRESSKTKSIDDIIAGAKIAAGLSLEAPIRTQLDVIKEEEGDDALMESSIAVGATVDKESEEHTFDDVFTFDYDHEARPTKKARRDGGFWQPPVKCTEPFHSVESLRPAVPQAKWKRLPKTNSRRVKYYDAVSFHPRELQRVPSHKKVALQVQRKSKYVNARRHLYDKRCNDIPEEL
ncbi:unnamed protein product [Jaminaea pallidilutea]